MYRKPKTPQNPARQGSSPSTSPVVLARRAITALTGLAVGLAYLAAAPVAHAAQAPDPPYGGPVSPKPTPAAVTRVVHLGGPLWLFILVAVTSIVLTAAAAMAISRLRQPARVSPTRA